MERPETVFEWHARRRNNICSICRMIGKDSAVGDCICAVESRGYF